MPVTELRGLAEARVGQTLKGWSLLRLLGTGPLTAAYEATRGAGDVAEHVTLKLMMGALASFEPAKAQFLRGAYASNRFHHARVLPIAADGTDENGAAFVVRAWTDAEPLDAWVTKKGANLTERQVLKIGELLLDALEISNAHGIVHGAVSPQNILVTSRGTIRLCDFATPPGLGLRAEDDEDVLSAARIGPFTAPERCSGGLTFPSEQADVYSVAASLYAAFAGKPPRGEALSAEDLAKTPPRPLREVAPSVSEPLTRVIHHGLSREPKDRYPSAYAMLGDIRRVMAGRAPKLGESKRPVPSGSFGDLPRLSRAGHVQTGRFEPPRSGDQPAIVAAGREEWRGNAVLILAIALLVGVATFVIVRERIDDQKSLRAPSPPASAATH